MDFLLCAGTAECEKIKEFWLQCKCSSRLNELLKCCKKGFDVNFKGMMHETFHSFSFIFIGKVIPLLFSFPNSFLFLFSGIKLKC